MRGLVPVTLASLFLLCILIIVKRSALFKVPIRPDVIINIVKKCKPYQTVTGIRATSLSPSLACLIEFLFDVLSVVVFVIRDRFAKKPTRA